MGRHIQDGTGVVISVADEKDARYASGWKPYEGEDDKSTTSRRATKKTEQS